MPSKDPCDDSGEYIAPRDQIAYGERLGEVVEVIWSPNTRTWYVIARHFNGEPWEVAPQSNCVHVLKKGVK